MHWTSPFERKASEPKSIVKSPKPKEFNRRKLFSPEGAVVMNNTASPFERKPAKPPQAKPPQAKSPVKSRKRTCKQFHSRKRRAAGEDTVTMDTMVFDNISESKFFLRCGQHHEHSTPCVNRSALDLKYAVVYEQWQRYTSKGDTQYFGCRRRGNTRNKNGVRHVSESGRKRQPRTKTEYVGCGCPARFSMHTDRETGQVKIVFKGQHNHDVQRNYVKNFLNPIVECFAIREIVDNKLFAGICNVQRILSAVLNETFKKRLKRMTFEQLRTYHMAVFLTRKQIQNRVGQLGLNADALLNKYVLHIPNICS